jgi:hypothetical protein
MNKPSITTSRQSPLPAVRTLSPSNGGEGNKSNYFPLELAGRGARAEGKRPRCWSRSALSKLPPSKRESAFSSLPVLAKWLVSLALINLGIASKNAASAADWTDMVEVRQETRRCVSYRARLDGQFLVVQAIHEEGWHTYAMDNKRRAQEKLAGKKSLGIDRPTEIELTDGLELAGPWYQSPPKDFSKPELRWFSWGFEGRVLFVAKVRYSGAGPARLTIHGQACSQATCKNIEVGMSVPLAKSNIDVAASEVDLRNLVPVR